MTNQTQTPSRSPAGTWFFALLPLALMGALVALFITTDPTSLIKTSFPPKEELSFQKVTLTPGLIALDIVNDGPDPITIAQALVDDAYWNFSIEPGQTLERLGRATVNITYPWVPEETHAIVLITATGVTFEHEIAVAVESPKPTLALFGMFALLGLFVGVIPVTVGLLWLPALRQTSQKWMEFFLLLTIGLLVFLGFDALKEALETIELVPGSYQGMGILVIGSIGSFALLTAVQNEMTARQVDASTKSLSLATMIAVGIGLHNLAEGLAIGAAYALGEIALGSMLVMGFMLHNVTEGLAIVAPLARTKAGLTRLLMLGAIGGVPTIFGAWIGGFTYSPVWALLFLAIGAGAIFQVAWQIITQLSAQRERGRGLLDFTNVLGLLVGFLIMYVTGFFVAA
jgi:ZIP family zinc transporter